MGQWGGRNPAGGGDIGRTNGAAQPRTGNGRLERIVVFDALYGRCRGLWRRHWLRLGLLGRQFLRPSARLGFGAVAPELPGQFGLPALCHYLLQPAYGQLFLVTLVGVAVLRVAIVGPAQPLQQRELLAAVTAPCHVVPFL